MDGKKAVPITDARDWASAYDRKNRMVAQTELGEYWVSTVFLGLNHQFGDGPPLIFETMVFPQDSYSELRCDRYSTWKQAEAGHAEAIQWVKDGMPEEE